MRYDIVLGVVGSNLKYISVVLLIPIIFALIYGEFSHILPFAICAITSVIFGFLFAKGKNDSEIDNIKKSEALASVFFSWVMFSLVCSIPYFFYHFTPINAFFEAVSGITTTGATVIQDFSAYPKTLFFYRSMTQWFGGMGIVVLFIAVLPKFAVAGRQMFSAEAPVPLEEKVTPRIKYTATWLWTMYLGLTIIEIIALKLCGMDFYNAICNSLSTVSTGGFSPNPESIMGYHNSKITTVVLIFMFLAGANFILQYKIFIQRKWQKFWQNEEFITYLGVFLFISVVTALILGATQEGGFSGNFLDSAFQTISMMTSGGFASVDFIKWNTDAKIMLFVAAFVGGCAASTAGGLKIVRWIFLTKYIKREIAKIIHPSAVYPIKLEGKSVAPEIGGQIVAFCVFYFLIFALSALAVALIEKNPALALSGSISTLGNVGPGVSAVIGPMTNFDSLTLATKWIFIFNMLVGRLELVPFLALLHKDVWSSR